MLVIVGVVEGCFLLFLKLNCSVWVVLVVSGYDIGIGECVCMCVYYVFLWEDGKFLYVDSCGGLLFECISIIEVCVCLICFV